MLILLCLTCLTSLGKTGGYAYSLNYLYSYKFFNPLSAQRSRKSNIFHGNILPQLWAMGVLIPVYSGLTHCRRHRLNFNSLQRKKELRNLAYWREPRLLPVTSVVTTWCRIIKSKSWYHKILSLFTRIKEASRIIEGEKGGLSP